MIKQAIVTGLGLGSLYLLSVMSWFWLGITSLIAATIILPAKKGWLGDGLQNKINHLGADLHNLIEMAVATILLATLAAPTIFLTVMARKIFEASKILYKSGLVFYGYLFPDPEKTTANQATTNHRQLIKPSTFIFVYFLCGIMLPKAIPVSFNWAIAYGGMWIAPCFALAVFLIIKQHHAKSAAETSQPTKPEMNSTQPACTASETPIINLEASAESTSSAAANGPSAKPTILTAMKRQVPIKYSLPILIGINLLIGIGLLPVWVLFLPAFVSIIPDQIIGQFDGMPILTILPIIKDLIEHVKQWVARVDGAFDASDLATDSLGGKPLPGVVAANLHQPGTAAISARTSLLTRTDAKASGAGKDEFVMLDATDATSGV